MSDDRDHNDYLIGHPGPSSFERVIVRAIRVALGIGGLTVMAFCAAAIVALYVAFFKWSIGV